MTTIVIMPGGFHPFHAGHLALYQSAQRAFPDADVYVAATNDTSARPFPFPVKEKLAKLAGVEPGHFVQVKSPFRAEEITAKFDPARDTLIFVRSEKDSTKPPQAGGVKKDGSPAYLQPLLGAKKLEPFAKHAYMAYLPTVEFGPGMTSATEIRTAWPTLNDKRKTALVMSLYPRTQGNAKLAATVVGLLDAAIGTELGEGIGDRPHDPAPGKEFVSNKHFVKFTPTAVEVYYGGNLVLSKPGDFSNPTRQDMYNARRYTSDLFNKQLKQKELARIASKTQGVSESQEFMSDAQFYGGLLSVLATMGAGLAVSAYMKIKDVVKMYNADQIIKALEGYQVTNISAKERQVLTGLIAQFKQAMSARQGAEALAIAKQIKSISTNRSPVAEGSESSIQKKIQAKQDSLSLAREQRRARGQRQQGPREIKLQAEIDKLNTELTQLKRQGVAEGFSDIVKGVKRKVAGKEDPKEVEHMYGRIARSSIKHKTPDQAEKDVERYKKVAKVVNKEDIAEGQGWIGDPAKWKEAVLQAHGPDVVFKNYSHPGQPGKRSVNAINAAGKQVGVYQRHNKMGMVQPNMQGVAEDSLNEFAVDGFGDSGDNRSKLLASVGRLLDGGNKVDWQVPGQMGHVTRVQNDGITMKRWKMPRSRMSFFLPMSDDSRDSKYTIKMVAPKHYAVVSAAQGMAEAAKKCPPATQDIGINLENRQKAIDEYGYGPLNPDLPNTKFWMKKVSEWNLDSMEEAQQSLCGNCAAFDIRQDTLDCIAQGIDSDSPEDAEGVIDAGELGYCKFLKFKCASRRTCDAWVTGGPLQDKPMDENQGWAATYETSAQNFVGGMKAGYQARENQPVAEQDLDYIEEKWSAKYKSSIDCADPQGFSQKAHCAGRKK